MVWKNIQQIPKFYEILQEHQMSCHTESFFHIAGVGSFHDNSSL